MYATNLAALVRRWLLLSVLGVGWIVFAACEPPWPKCDSDKHCRPDKEGNATKKNYFCVQGQCQECRSEKDCGDRQKCEGYKCVEKTCGDVTCPGGKRCDPTTLGCKWICENDGDNPCDGDVCKVCKSHQCIDKPPPCGQDSDCPGQQICKSTGSGACERQCVGGCSGSKPCAAGKKCENGQCVEDACELKKVYYDYNRSFIRSDAKETLKENITCITKMKDKKIVITGHADERGTREFNIRLGERRAKSARSYLTKLGVEKDRFCTVVSKGKEEPEVPNASTDEQHQKNRRAVFDLRDGCP